MKKIKVILIFLIIFVIGLTIYKYKYYDNHGNNSHYFEYTEIKNKKRDVIQSEILDKDKYADKIITENILYKDYSFSNDEGSINGKIYIGTDKKLYITNEVDNSAYNVSSDKYKTLYVKDYQYEGIYVYLLTEDGRLSIMELTENDITKAVVNQYTVNLKLTNFVDIEFKSDKFKPGNTMFVLAENGKIYDINSATRYNEDIVSLFNTIYVYGDKTMSNVYGEMLEDKDGNYYKIKNIFWVVDGNDFIKNRIPIILTEDNKFLYMDFEFMNVYEFSKKVTKMDFKAALPYEKDELIVTFDDDYEVKLNVYCSNYYCVNDFVE